MDMCVASESNHFDYFHSCGVRFVEGNWSRKSALATGESCVCGGRVTSVCGWLCDVVVAAVGYVFLW